MKKTFIPFVVFLLLAFAVQLNAQIPRMLSYQGILTDNAGKPRPDGDYQFTFCLYNTATGGAPIWTEQKNLPVKNGLFSTIMGDATPFGAAVKFDKPYWLGIRVGNEAELSPRIPLTSVGYSLSALRADTASFSVASSTDTTWKLNNSNIYRMNGNVGIGTSNPIGKLTLAAKKDFALVLNNEGAEYNKDIQFMVNSIRRWCIRVQDAETGNNSGSNFQIIPRNDKGENLTTAIFIERSTSNVGIGTYNPSALLDVGGRTKTKVLEITGGSDLAEPFEISHANSLPVGSLVVIDPEQPGKLKQATEPYDKRVAGVISGAGGINPGLTLTQEGKLTGSQHVALTGKVYALATAANGAIEPGDLLTTSSIPGHAMKATDQTRWPGAVIGKAMSVLKEGEGLVLVLIQPH